MAAETFDLGRFPSLGKDVENFFFGAQNKVGWPSDSPDIKPHPLIKDWKVVTYQEEYIDPLHGLYFTDEWGEKGGRTIISLQYFATHYTETLPLWVMSYQGEKYSPSVLPIVRSALSNAYSRKFFFGGRGSREFRMTEGGLELVYCNDYSPSGTFGGFSGNEWVEDCGARRNVGGHSYRGGFLVPVD